jgi:hypothetical protein
VSIVSIVALVVGLRGDFRGIHQLGQKPVWVQWAWAGCVLVVPMFFILAKVMWDRSRIVASDIGDVWVRNGQCGDVRFRWPEIARWRVDITPNDGTEGPPDFRTIVVELSDGRMLLLRDDCQAFVRAFEENARDRRSSDRNVPAQPPAPRR